VLRLSSNTADRFDRLALVATSPGGVFASYPLAGTSRNQARQAANGRVGGVAGTSRLSSRLSSAHGAKQRHGASVTHAGVADGYIDTNVRRPDTVGCLQPVGGAQ
jgi:hypothetical protein